MSLGESQRQLMECCGSAPPGWLHRPASGGSGPQEPIDDCFNELLDAAVFFTLARWLANER